MADSPIPLSAIGVSPVFKITGEEFRLRYFQALSPIDWDMVKPPWFGEHGGFSVAMEMINRWFPWADEKLIPPKYDGVCEFLGMASNRPTQIKDYHFLAVFRAVDYVLAPRYRAYIQATVSGPTPNDPTQGQG